MIGILNAHMWRWSSEPGEHVEWATVDVDSREVWEWLLDQTVEEYAEANPHMIVFEVAETP